MKKKKRKIAETAYICIKENVNNRDGFINLAEATRHVIVGKHSDWSTDQRATNQMVGRGGGDLRGELAGVRAADRPDLLWSVFH